MLEYAPMLHVSYYSKNYAGIIHQGLSQTVSVVEFHTQHLQAHSQTTCTYAA